jgi:hypothetical protein
MFVTHSRHARNPKLNLTSKDIFGISEFNNILKENS